ncbi:MAG: Maf family protein, partial [Thiobacillus sp.]|nr:Maf family protein [Thiobacillus sp.]
MLVDKRIYLASQSPRRRELLKQLGVAFDVLPLRAVAGRMDVIEIPHADETAPEFAQRMAIEKAACGWRAVDARHVLRFPVLGADTVVELDGA